MDCLSLLIENGASLDVKNDLGNTALIQAVKCANEGPKDFKRGNKEC